MPGAGSASPRPNAGCICRTAFATLVALGLLAPLPGHTQTSPAGNRPVVLLHGLARTARSMRPIAATLEDAGRRVCNLDYPSTKATVQALVEDHVLPAIRDCANDSDAAIDFVTHSMGGILVRVLAEHDDAPDIGRVVMLSPPNHGSELVDRLGDWWLFRWWNGPAGVSLGTDESALPARLGEPGFEFAVITGDRSLNPLFSRWIPGADDGKVSVDSARLDGMAGFRTVPASHTFIMRDDAAIGLTLQFLADGRFDEP